MQEDERLLARVPETTDTLRVGSLLAATILTFLGSLFPWYSLVQGRFYGYAPYQMVLAAVQFTAVTAFKALGVRWTSARVR